MLLCSELVLGNALDAHQFSLKDEDAVARDWTNALAAISPLRLDCQLPLLARTHVKKTLIPSFDYTAAADRETEGLTAVVGGIELCDSTVSL